MLEINSLETYNLIHEIFPCNDAAQRVLHYSIGTLLSRDWLVQIRHIFHSTNLVADYLAKQGALGEVARRVWMSPPDEVHAFLSCDVTT